MPKADWSPAKARAAAAVDARGRVCFTDPRYVGDEPRELDFEAVFLVEPEDRGGVYVFDSTGRPLAFVPTPGAPTNCVFGTGAQKNTLFITAAGQGGKYSLYRIGLLGQ